MHLRFNLMIFQETYKDDNYALTKHFLKEADFRVAVFHPLNEKSYSEKSNFEEPFQKINVEGDFHAISKHHRIECYQAYEEFIKNWSKNLITIKKYKIKDCIEPRAIPWITLQNDKAFSYRLDSSHERVSIPSVKFGSLLNSSHFVCHAELQSDNREQIDNYWECLEASFFHDTKQAELIFEKQYAMRFRYSDVRQVIVEKEADKRGLTLYLVMINPPSVVECNEMTSQRYKNLNTLSSKPPLRYNKTILTIPGVSPDILGRSNAIVLRIPEDDTARNITSRLYFRMNKKEIAYTVMDCETIIPPRGFPDLDIGHFDCTYVLTALLRRRFAIQLQNAKDEMKELLNKLSSCALKSAKGLYMALEETLLLMDEGMLLNYGKIILDLFDKNYFKLEKLKGNNSLLPQNTKKVWRVVVTPTRLMLYPAEEIFGNRVIRQFSCSHALRVSFRDDCFQRLSSASNYCTDEYINAIISEQMEEGLRIGSRHYEFLGWSNSQLRDHGAYMYAKDPKGNTAASIRNWMGDFSSIKTVPKYMARMGQCFSHTEPTISVPLSSNRVKTLPDVEGGINPANGKPYCFSDGVGRISQQLMKQVTDIVGYNYIPSAIQFRYAGYKGMLSLDPTLTDCDIVFRESQMKFPCAVSEKLEVVSKSTATALQLNKQLITILDQKGVPSAVFLDLQQNMLRELTEMLFENEAAAIYLSTHSAMPGIDFKRLAKAGFGLNNEPLFRNILLAQHSVALEGIKEKARLDIDHKLARNMFGIMDETGQLEYGQVFVQYTSDISENADRSRKMVHVGKVMVTKNPCLQLGDVRIFDAVNIPQLSHIVDCIVFPSKGPRPHPSEMAGSDLDGDEYAVIWKKELFFEGENDKASVFPIPSQEIHHGEIKISDMLQFLRKYIMNDRLGVIANAHLARADDPEIGLRDPICERIAQKFSIAVDFAKNGQEVKLEPEERPDKYPDFMGKGSHANTYKSKRVLGRLYRICKEYEEENRISAEKSFKFEIDKDLIVPGFEKYSHVAEVACQKYCRSLGSVLSHYGIESDYEACGKALKKMHSRLERQERLDIEEILTKHIHHLWKITEDEFMAEFDVSNYVNENFSQDAMKKASAYYAIAYMNPKKYYLSFAWIMWRILLAIKKSKMPFVIVVNPYIDRLDKELDEWLGFNTFDPLSQNLKNLCKKKNPKKLSFVDTYQLELALQILLRWASAENILSDNQEPEPTNIYKGELEAQLDDDGKTIPSTYLTLLFFESIKNYKKHPKLMDLLLQFFSLCIVFRFVTNANNKWTNNIQKKHKYLGKKAMATYHSLAVGSSFTCLGLVGEEAPYDVIEVSEMDPVRIQASLVEGISFDNYAPLIKHLQKESKAKSISVRKISRHLLISALGTKLSHQLLKKALYKITTKNM